jgi:uncharacterized membrane protein YeiB
VTVPDTTAPRHVGVDAARGLAVVGMIVAHVLPRTSDAELVVDGRPSILFAVLAGISLGLLAPTRAAGAQGAGVSRARARGSLTLRALLLMALGLWLWTLPTNIAIILDAYGLMFLLMVPLVFASRVVLAVVAAILLAVGPLLVAATAAAPAYVLFSGATPIERVLALIDNPAGVVANALVTGYYPALLWLPLLCVGLIATKSGLTRKKTQLFMIVGGLAATIAGYGAGLLLDGVTAEAHSVTPAELCGSGGFAVALIGLSLLLLDGGGRAARWARLIVAPLIAIGRMPLTVYTLHVLLIAIASAAFAIGPAGAYDSPAGWWMLVALVLISTVLALIAQHQGRRGPLEAVLAATTATVAGTHAAHAAVRD